jgi:hypothetical protein
MSETLPMTRLFFNAQRNDPTERWTGLRENRAGARSGPRRGPDDPF